MSIMTPPPMKPAPTQTATTDAEKMVARADQQMAQIAVDTRQVLSKLQEVQGKLAELRQARLRQTQFIQNAQSQVALLSKKHTEAVGYANLAEGLPNEQATIQHASEVRKEWQAAQETLETATHEIDLGARDANRQEQELMETEHALQEEATRLQNGLAQVQAARELAHAQSGQQKFADLSKAYQDHQRQVEALGNQFVEAKADLHDVFTMGVAGLAQWPDLQHAFARLQQSDDGVIRLLRAADLFIETIQREAASTTAAPFRKHDLLLTIPAVDIANASRWPEPLKQRRAIIASLLQEYRDANRG